MQFKSIVGALSVTAIAIASCTNAAVIEPRQDGAPHIQDATNPEEALQATRNILNGMGAKAGTTIITISPAGDAKQPPVTNVPGVADDSQYANQQQPPAPVPPMNNQPEAGKAPNTNEEGQEKNGNAVNTPESGTMNPNNETGSENNQNANGDKNDGENSEKTDVIGGVKKQAGKIKDDVKDAADKTRSKMEEIGKKVPNSMKGGKDSDKSNSKDEEDDMYSESSAAANSARLTGLAAALAGSALITFAI